MTEQQRACIVACAQECEADCYNARWFDLRGDLLGAACCYEMAERSAALAFAVAQGRVSHG